MPMINGQVIDENDFINLAERDATPANDAGRVVKLESDGYLSESFLRFRRSQDSWESINGAATPQAISLASDGTILLAEADVSTRLKFVGFVNDNYSSYNAPAYVNGLDDITSNSGFNFTANAGTNRVIILFTYHGSTGPAVPSAVTWNGLSMTLLESDNTGSDRSSCWIVPIGTSGSSQASSFVITGAGGVAYRYQALVYQNVDQTTPTSDSALSIGTTTATATLTVTRALNLIVANASTGGTPALTGFTTRLSGGSVVSGELLQPSTAPAATGTGTTFVNTTAISLNAASVNSGLKFRYRDIVPGFSGLTPGATYFVSNTAGAISTTPGGTSVQVGYALSATELLITS